jgi:tetratricopeptide (TPR) repeat protein
LLCIQVLLYSPEQERSIIQRDACWQDIDCASKFTEAETVPLNTGKKLAVTALAFGLLQGTPATGESDDEINQPPPVARFAEAFDILVEADMARDAGDRAKAVELYKEGHESYSAFRAQHPDWKPALTEFRIKYCSNQVQSLSADVPRGENAEVTEHDLFATNLPPEDSSALSPGPMETKTARSEFGRRANTRARAMITQGNMDAANEVLFENLQMNPDDRKTRLLLGVVHCCQSNYNNALHLLEPLAEETPDNPPVYMTLGAAQAGLGRFEQAEASILKAVELDPENAQAHYNMAVLEIQKSEPDIDKARRHYRRALSLGARADKRLDEALQ